MLQAPRQLKNQRYKELFNITANQKNKCSLNLCKPTLPQPQRNIHKEYNDERPYNSYEGCP